ncbi:hypothetical protein P7C73_g6633, partial [Tremellales sp. Uapishka_1]
MQFGGTPKCESCGTAVYHAEQVMGPSRKANIPQTMSEMRALCQATGSGQSRPARYQGMWAVLIVGWSTDDAWRTAVLLAMPYATLWYARSTTCQRLAVLDRDDTHQTVHLVLFDHLDLHVPYALVAPAPAHPELTVDARHPPKL